MKCLALFALLAGACTDTPTLEPIDDAQLSGMLGGSAWEPATIDLWVPDASSPSDWYDVVIHKEPQSAPCTWWRPLAEPDDANYLLLRFPPTVGTYTLERGAVGIWISPADDKAPGGRGRIEIASVSADRAQGGVIADFGEDGAINGSFDTMTFCGRFDP